MHPVTWIEKSPCLAEPYTHPRTASQRWHRNKQLVGMEWRWPMSHHLFNIDPSRWFLSSNSDDSSSQKRKDEGRERRDGRYLERLVSRRSLLAAAVECGLRVGTGKDPCLVSRGEGRGARAGSGGRVRVQGRDGAIAAGAGGTRVAHRRRPHPPPAPRMQYWWTRALSSSSHHRKGRTSMGGRQLEHERLGVVESVCKGARGWAIASGAAVGMGGVGRPQTWVLDLFFCGGWGQATGERTGNRQRPACNAEEAGRWRYDDIIWVFLDVEINIQEPNRMDLTRSPYITIFLLQFHS